MKHIRSALPPVHLQLPLLRLEQYEAVLRKVFELPHDWRAPRGLARALASVEGPPRLFLHLLGAIQRIPMLTGLFDVPRMRRYLLNVENLARRDACDGALVHLSGSLSPDVYAPLVTSHAPPQEELQLLRLIMALVVTGAPVRLAPELGWLQEKLYTVNDIIERGWALGTEGTRQCSLRLFCLWLSFQPPCTLLGPFL